MQYQLKESNCPKCNSALDACTATGGENIPPEPGAITVCVYCSAILEVTEYLGLELISEEKLNKMKQEDPVFEQDLNRSLKIAEWMRTGKQSKLN